MNCTNCGAVLELVESRRYLQCRHCGTSHFPDSLDADGIRIVGPAPDAPWCPVCRAALKAALVDEDHPIHLCERCRGVLLPRATFATVVNKRRAWATSPPAEPVPLERQQLQRKVDCPSCGAPFETYPHYGPGNVVIDNCSRCDLIWLDFGEMRQLVDAPGRDRGSRHVPRVDERHVRRGAGDDEEEAAEGEEPLTTLFKLLFR